jgi:hypothetical protein
MNKYTNKNKKQLFEKINTLSKTEHEEIYKIVRKNNDITFSKNKNGIFFNLSDISDSMYEELDNFVTYCINNKKNLDDYDKKINECKINNNYNNIIHINLDTLPQENALIEKMELEDWNKIILDSKAIQKVSTYVEKLMNDRDKICKKKNNVKFNNAKKKFAKKIYSEKKIENDVSKDLEIESYLKLY